MGYTKRVNFTETGQYGNGPADEDDVYTIQEFNDFCEAGAFIDYDGFGHPVKDRMLDESVWVKPSKRHLIPEDATHIVWYNR